MADTANKHSEKSENSENSGKRKKAVILIVAILLIVAAATVGVLFFCGVFSPAHDPQEDAKGVVGVITDNWDPNTKEESSSQKSGTRIPGYSSAEMNAGDKSLKLRIGNPKENKVGFFASLQLEDGTILYESGLLKPGQGLTEIPLNQTLEKGIYNAKVVYQCVLLNDENTPLNAAESGFQLIVK